MDAHDALVSICVLIALLAPTASLAGSAGRPRRREPAAISDAENSPAGPIGTKLTAHLTGDTLRIMGSSAKSIRLSRSGEYVKINGADPESGAVGVTRLKSIVLHAGPDTRSVEIDYDSPLTRLAVTANGAAVSVAGSLEVTGDLLIEAAKLTVDARVTGPRVRLMSRDEIALSARGALRVPGGQVAIRSTDGRVALRPGSLIEASAPRSGMAAGRIEIDGTDVLAAGQIRATGGQGEITLSAGESGDLSLFGNIDAAGPDAGERGGTVRLVGKRLALMQSARIDVSGRAGGGTVLAGGDLGGKGPSLRSGIAAVMPGAQVDADALEHGDGGTVGVWSNSSTAFAGDVSARGGANGGDGGTVDLSSAGKLAAEGKVDVAAPLGKAGKVSFDPMVVVIWPRDLEQLTPPSLAIWAFDLDWLTVKSQPSVLTNVGLFLLEKYVEYDQLLAQNQMCSTPSPDSACIGCLICSEPYNERPLPQVLQLFGPLAEPEVVFPSGLRVKYGSGTSLYSILAKLAEFPPLKVAGYFPIVSAETLEQVTGDISIDSFFGIFLEHGVGGGVVDELFNQSQPFLDPMLNLQANAPAIGSFPEPPAHNATFRTLGPIVSLGGIRYNGAKIDLHAGARFEADALNGLLATVLSFTPIPFADTIVQLDQVRQAFRKYTLDVLRPVFDPVHELICALNGTSPTGSDALAAFVGSLGCIENGFAQNGLSPNYDLEQDGVTDTTGISCQAAGGLWDVPWLNQLAQFAADPTANFQIGYQVLTASPPDGVGAPPLPSLQDAADKLSAVVGSVDDLLSHVITPEGALDCSQVDALTSQAVGDACDAAIQTCNAACTTTGSTCESVCNFSGVDPCAVACNGTLATCNASCGAKYTQCAGGCATSCILPNSSACKSCLGSCSTQRTGCRNVCASANASCLNACAADCGDCVAACQAGCAATPCNVSIDLQTPCEQWPAQLMQALTDRVVPFFEARVKETLGLPPDTDLTTLVNGDCEPTRIPDFELKAPINAPLFVNGDIVRGDAESDASGEIVLENDTAGSIAFSGKLEGEKVTVRASSPQLVFDGNLLSFEGRKVGGPIRNAKIDLLVPAGQKFGAGEAEIRALTVELEAAGGIGEITGFGDSETPRDFLNDLLSGLDATLGATPEFPSGADPGNSTLALMDDIVVPVMDSVTQEGPCVQDQSACFTYQDGGPIPYIKIGPPASTPDAPVNLTAVNLETGGIYLKSDADLRLGASSRVINSAEPLGFFELDGVPRAPRSFKTSGPQDVELSVQGNFTLDGAINNERGDVHLSAGQDLILSSGSRVEAGGNSIVLSAGPGGSISANGVLQAAQIEMQGSPDNPDAPQTLHLESSASADHEIHVVGSASAADVLDFDRQGLDVIQGLDGDLRVSDRQPVFVDSIERINGVPPTVYPCVRGSAVDPCPSISVGPGISLSLKAGFVDWGAEHWTVTVNYGDGSATDTMGVNGAVDGSGPFPLRVALNHAYADTGSYSIEVCVRDDGDGGQSCASEPIDVAAQPCLGDCNQDRTVAVDELVTGVNIALGREPIGDCSDLDRNQDDFVTIDELVTAVDKATQGCGGL